MCCHLFIISNFISTGYYLLFEASGSGPGAKARILKSYQPTSAMCFSFWYMMYGSTLGTLNLYKKVGSNLGSPIWSISGDQGLRRTWLKGQVTVNSSMQFSVSL